MSIGTYFQLDWLSVSAAGLLILGYLAAIGFIAKRRAQTERG